MRNYDNEAYANGRLAGTIVRTKEGRAIEVQAIGGKIVAAKELITGTVIQFPYAELDITPVPLGYVNVGSKAVYYSRIPLRNDWKQGARQKNLRASMMEWVNDGEEPEPMPREERLPLKQIGLTIEGVYPNYDGVLKSLIAGKDVMSKAWCRVFAMDKTMNIFHRGIFHVGKMIDPANRRYELNDKSWWVKEALEESLA